MKTAVREKLEPRIKKIKTLPALPAVLIPLMECMEKPADRIDVNRVVQLVSYDKSIAAQCLQMTNSAMFGRRRDVETVREAVIALGMWRVSDIVFSCTLPNAFSLGTTAIDPLVFWRHSLSCALICQRLAQLVRSQSAEKAYLAGLLHDLGVMANAEMFPKEFQAAYQKAAAEYIPLDVAEREVLGFTHAESGQVLGQTWKFSKDICTVLEFHHDVTAAPEAKDLVALVHLSDLLCRYRGMGYGYYEAREIDFTCSPAWLILVQTCTQMDRPDVTRFAQELEKYFEEVVARVDNILGPMAQKQMVPTSK